jgi:hypothetical protein
MGIERESHRIRNALRQERPYCRFLKQMDLFILRDPIAAFCRPEKSISFGRTTRYRTWNMRYKPTTC